MKQLLSCLLLCSHAVLAQTTEIPVTIFCNPAMPRLNEYTTVQLLLPEWKTNITAAAQQQHPSVKMDQSGLESRLDLFTFRANQTGQLILGPYHFESNGIHYVTNTLSIRIDDSLPAVTEGLWIRSVKQSDSVWCLTIDQRKPVAEDMKTMQLRKEVPIDLYKGYTVFDLPPSAYAKLEPLIWEQGSRLESIRIEKEERYYFANLVSVCLQVNPHLQPIVIDRSYFSNLPANFPFEPMVIP